MSEIKRHIVTVLLWFSLSLVLSGVVGNEKKRWESVFKTIMESDDPSKEPKVFIDFVGQELEKWRFLEASQKRKFLSTESSEIMDRLTDLNELNSDCENKHLKKRFELERDFNQNYVNLHPYIKFTNLMLFNSCYQDYKYKLMLTLNINLDKIKFLAWYDATEDRIGEPEFRMAAMRSNSFRQKEPIRRSLTEVERELKDVASKLALYLKHFYPKIESKYFKSAKEHADKIKFEVDAILNTVCPRITKLNSNWSSSDTELATSSQQGIPTMTMAHGPIDAEYHSLMKDVSKSVDGDNARAFVGYELYKYQWVCEQNNWRQLVERVQRYFVEFLDEIESEDKITADWPHVTLQDLKSTRQVLFAQNNYPKVRMGHQYDLLNRLYIGLRDGLLTEDSDNLARLVELRDLSPEKCLMVDSQLNERLDLETIYDRSYVVLNSYVASLNRLQWDLCNQRLRQLVSSVIPRDAVQLAKLEKLRTLIDQDSHEWICPHAFKRGVADFIFLSSPSKISKKLVPRKVQELLGQACRGVTRLMSLMSILERHDALMKYHFEGPFNDATKRALSYGRICKYYEQNKSQLAPQLFDSDVWFESAPQRHPNHLSGHSLLSCLKPKVKE